MTALRRRMIEDMTLRNFAPRTIKVYIERVVAFARFFHTTPARLGPEHIRGYLLHLIQERHVSWSEKKDTRCNAAFR
jgi:integrase/recombinase XerD